uniref:Uncharacterized protein n=1 Tax=Lactuca sativa TaxID=4236 RepID=A0A9R1W4R9_LACSA|nr:hypothetical protein LSAT_V11C300148460 [Lactuca sativa]
MLDLTIALTRRHYAWSPTYGSGSSSLHVLVLEFRQRVFLFVSFSCSVRVVDFIYMFNNLVHRLNDVDVMRVSLLFYLEQEFLGKYPRPPVIAEHMTLESNLDEFNSYPWCRVMWDFTNKQLRSMFDKIEEFLNPNVPRIISRHTYCL